MPNLRMYARGRPQILQRLCLRVENLGFFTFCGLTLLSAPSFTLFAVVAKNQLLAFALSFLLKNPMHETAYPGVSGGPAPDCRRPPSSRW
jgi:hypothetical protein